MSSRHTQPRSKLFKTVSSSILGHMNAVDFQKKTENEFLCKSGKKLEKKDK